MRTILVALSLLLFLASPARGDEVNRRTLRGLSGTMIEVKGADEAGLSAKEIRTLVELRLRQTGIRVVEELTPQSPAGERAMLTVGVSAEKPKPGQRFLSSNKIVLSQVAGLVRDPTIEVIATTWEWHGLVLASDRKKILDDIDRGMNEFLNDYLAVNPKK